MKSKAVKIEGLGIAQLTRRRRTKNIVLRVHGTDLIKVSLPYWTSYREAIKFVEKSRAWIEKQFRVNGAKTSQLSLFGIPKNLELESYIYNLKPRSGGNISVRVKIGLIEVLYPEVKSLHDADVQRAIKRGYLKALKLEAQNYFPHKLTELSNRYGFKCKKLYLKDAYSQWGSCSHKNNINLSIHLMRLPEDLREYIMIHELVHTTEKNHGEGFYGKLGSIYKNYKSYEKRLKKFERPII